MRGASRRSRRSNRSSATRNSGLWLVRTMLESPRRFPGYQILAEAGRGKKCVVYRALELETGLEYALKIPLPDPVEDWKVRCLRFAREARAMACVDPTPAIPIIRSINELHGQPFMILEYVEGTTFTSAVSQGSMDVSQGIQIVGSIAGAASCLHKCGAIHRNVCPENVLIGRDGLPKLTGFSRVGFLTRPMNKGKHKQRTSRPSRQCSNGYSQS